MCTKQKEFSSGLLAQIQWAEYKVLRFLRCIMYLQMVHAMLIKLLCLGAFAVETDR